MIRMVSLQWTLSYRTLASTRSSSLHSSRGMPPIFRSDEQSMKASTRLAEYSYKRRKRISTLQLECDGNTHSYRYLITNYEYNNFSVAQARFQDNLSTDIIPIPSKNFSPERKQRLLNTSCLVGISVGGFVVLVMLVLIIHCALKRRRKKAEIRSHDFLNVLKSSSQSDFPLSISTQEIGRNSWFTVNHELHGNAMVEMHDQSIPAQGVSEIAELPQSPSQNAETERRMSDVVERAAHELYTCTISSRTPSQNNLERSHPAAPDHSVGLWTILKALKLTQQSTKTLPRNLSTLTAISKCNLNSPISSQCGPARDNSTPRDHTDQTMSSTRSSLQTTYANLFDYDFYLSRSGTPAEEDSVGHT